MKQTKSRVPSILDKVAFLTAIPKRLQGAGLST